MSKRSFFESNGGEGVERCYITRPTNLFFEIYVFNLYLMILHYL